MGFFLNERLDRARESLRCPVCKGSLTVDGSDYYCSACRTSYSFVGDIVAFCRKEAIVSALEAEKQDKENVIKNWLKRWPRFYEFLTHLIVPALFNGLTVKKFLRRFPEDGSVRILNVGAGPIRYHRDAIGVDLYPFKAVDILADAAALPFEDGTFDAVCSEQVLEHVSHPFEMVQEMIRVTKPGGLIYLGAPFVYPYHPSPKDYTRWSMDGLREATKGCVEVESGMMAGPTSGMLTIFAVWLSILCTFGYTPIQRPLSYLFMLVLSPLKVLDYLYAHLPGANGVACSLYIVVRAGEKCLDV